MPRPPAQSYRLPPETIAQITEVASTQGGLSNTKVVQLAVARLHAAVCHPATAETTKRSKPRTAKGT